MEGTRKTDQRAKSTRIKRGSSPSRGGRGLPTSSGLLEKKPLLKENELTAARIIQPKGVKLKPPDQRRPVFIEGRRYEVTGKTQRELDENEEVLKRQIEAGICEDPTLNEYFRGWIYRKERTASKPVTPYRYRQMYTNHLDHRIGGRKLREIRRRNILNLQADLLEVVRPATVNQILQLLRQILGDAVCEELIAKNPAEGVRRLKDRGPKAAQTKHRALTEEEQKWFLEAARDSWYYEFFAFMLCTGMRQGEAAAITWGDVDREQNLLNVRSTLSFGPGGHVIIGSAKSDAGMRDIPMNQGIRNILCSQQQKLVRRWGQDWVAKDRVIFPSSVGRLLHNATANNALRRIQKGMKSSGHEVARFTTHALRDTFATRFIEQGGNPQTLKVILGHSSLKMTMDLYAHVLPGTKQKEMDMVRIF